MAATPTRNTARIIPSRRRGSTCGSTRLDYSSSLRVDQDISSRVCSLLLSRNEHRPPRTPYSSVEYLQELLSDTGEIAGGFDFSTARSVARQVQHDAGGLSLPGPLELFQDESLPRAAVTHLQHDGSFEEGNSTGLMEPRNPPFKRSTLRTSSANEPADDAELLAADVTRIKSNTSESSEQEVKLPRIALNDTVKRATTHPPLRTSNVPSGSSKNLTRSATGFRPRNITHTKSMIYKEMMERRKSIELLGFQYKAETSDIACFMTGCSPDPDCVKHPRRQGSRSKTMSSEEATRSPEQIEKGRSIDSATPFSTLTDGTFEKARDTGVESYLVSDVRGGMTQELEAKRIATVSVQSLRSSVTSADAFPHAMLSQKIAAKAVPVDLAQPLTTTIVTNFVFPASKTHKNPPLKLSRDDTRLEPSKSHLLGSSTNKIQPASSWGTGDPCKSDICQSCQSKNESILSTASRASSYRHALLKPWLYDTHALDVGLPVPPILTPITTLATRVIDYGLEQPLETNSEKRTPPMALLNGGTDEILRSAINDDLANLKEVEELVLVTRERIPNTSENGHMSTECDQDGSRLRDMASTATSWECQRPEVFASPQSSQERAVVSGERKAGHTTDSLAQATKDSKEYLKSSCRQLNFGSRESVTTIDLQDRDLHNPGKHQGGRAKNGRENNDRDDPKSGWKVSSPWKKDANTEYSLIPPRNSSRKLATTRTAQSANFSPIFLSKSKLPRTASVITIMSHGTSDLLSRSSLAVQASSKTLLEQESAKEPALLSQSRSNEKRGRKETLHWLREILTSTGPYESRLTALPARARRQQNSSTFRPSSQTLPVATIEELPIEAGLELVDERTLDTQLVEPSGGSRLKKKPSVSEKFSKTICDLEQLLNEALCIAKQAADHQETQNVPGYPKVDGIREVWNHDVSNASSVKSKRESTLIGSDTTFSSASSDDGSSEDRAQEKHGESWVARKQREIVRATENPTDKRGIAWLPAGQRAKLFPPVSFEKHLKSDVIPSGADLAAFNVEAVNHQAGRNPASSYYAAPIVSNQFKDVYRLTSKRKSGPQAESEKEPPTAITPLRNNDQIDESSAEQRVDSSNLDLGKGSTRARNIGPPRLPPRQYSLLRTVNQPQDLSNDPKRAMQNRRESLARVVTGKTFASQGCEYAAYSKMQSVYPASFFVRAIAPGPSMRSKYSQSFDGSYNPESEEIQWDNQNGITQQADGNGGIEAPHEAIELRDIPNTNLPEMPRKRIRHQTRQIINLKGRSHVSLREYKGFSLSRSYQRQTIARDWSPARKRFSAAVACVSTALVGILVGIYAGEVPAIQYYVVDFHHSIILGNVFFFLGLAIPTFFFWPLPLLHGRKPYVLGAMTLAMPLLFTQALVVGQFRSPYEIKWRIGLLLPRALMGFCLGFANMNFKSTLTDLFGASLQSSKPHQEVVDEFDVRRHGGGMGVWLGIWTWCCVGSIGIGFLTGAAIINHLNPAWGFHASICIIAVVLLLNVVTPEVRRSAYRRSIAEVKNGDQVSRRLARGEVKMHMVQTGPKWWGEECYYGFILSKNMLRQPGFIVMALYVAWMYGQMVLIIVLLGSLTSKRYKLRSPFVGLSVAVVPLGALLSVPFQKASIFSRSRRTLQDTDDATLDKKIHWSSHLVRRAIFILVLPFAGLAYMLTSTGPPLPFILPIVFAGLIGFLSNLAMAECHGIIMETFDTSDLQPGMTGRPRGASGARTAATRTNYSSFPRVTSAVAITEGLGYLLAAAATGVGGVAQRNLGQQAATGVMAGILLILSVLLLGVLLRFKEVQIIPDCKTEALEKWRSARRVSMAKWKSGVTFPLDEEPWRPVIIGNPTHSTRRMCVLELGSLSRFSEIRKRNCLVDEESLEARHPNLAALGSVKRKLREKEGEVRGSLRRSLSRGSVRSRDSLRSLGNLGSLKGRRTASVEGDMIDDVIARGKRREGVIGVEDGEGDQIVAKLGAGGEDVGGDGDGSAANQLLNSERHERRRDGPRRSQRWRKTARGVDGRDLERVSDLGGFREMSVQVGSAARDGRREQTRGVDGRREIEWDGVE